MFVDGDASVIRAQDRPQAQDEWDQAADLVLRVTTRAFGVERHDLMSKRRSKADIAFARQVAMYLFHVVFGGTYREVGQLFGRERTTVAYACSLVEDERDDIDLDRKLDSLEESLDRLWAIECLRRARSTRGVLRRSAAA
ncbi:MAG: chromosomal replication initiator DnaA [Parvularculaceae bacterium]|nr:chromosomal replication initiator DnaA [Parvularculaceae bacterium]